MINYTKTEKFENLRDALAINPPILVEIESERCRKMATNSKFISFDWKNSHYNCKKNQFERIVQTCPEDIPATFLATAVTKNSTNLLEAVNRIVPFLYIHELKFVKVGQWYVSFKRSAWNQKLSQNSLNFETISGLILLLILGFLCSYLVFLGEKIFWNFQTF